MCCLPKVNRIGYAPLYSFFFSILLLKARHSLYVGPLKVTTCDTPHGVYTNILLFMCFLKYVSKINNILKYFSQFI